MGSKNNWDADAMKGTLISDMEKEVREGISRVSTDGNGGKNQQPSAISHQPSEAEPTKGVQTYLPMSQYRRLNNLKLTRGENIATLAAQAITYWLDVQEGHTPSQL